jgi:hypothetical protein
MNDLKTRPVETLYEAGEVGAWKNLVFLRDGTVIPGELVYDSRDAALKQLQEFEDCWREFVSKYPNYDYYLTSLGFPWKHYSHAIPIPWKP